MLFLLLAWVGGVLAGNVARGSFAYSCVLICAVPALALLGADAAVHSWPGRRLVLAVVVLAILRDVGPMTWTYFDAARHVRPPEEPNMQFYAYWRDHPPDGPVLQRSAVIGCGHGFTQLLMPYGCTDVGPPWGPR